MTTYHIREDGNPGICTARAGYCPLTSVKEHFDSEESARSAFEKQMELLAKVKRMDWGDRREVARKHDVPSLVLEELARDEEESVRSALAENAFAYERVVDILAKDSSEHIRVSVACKPSLSKKTLDLLVVDESRQVRQMLAFNVFTPKSTLSRLARDEDSEVREDAISNLEDRLEEDEDD